MPVSWATDSEPDWSRITSAARLVRAVFKTSSAWRIWTSQHGAKRSKNSNDDSVGDCRREWLPLGLILLRTPPTIISSRLSQSVAAAAAPEPHPAGRLASPDSLIHALQLQPITSNQSNCHSQSLWQFLVESRPEILTVLIVTADDIVDLFDGT